MPKWAIWLIVGIAAFIVLGLILRKINRSFSLKYGFSIYGGAFLMLLAIGGAVGGAFMVKNDIKIGYALFALTVILLLITLIYDFKKCGLGGGILALFLQIVFCLPSLFIVFDLLFNRGRTTLHTSVNNDRYYRRRKQKDEYRRNGGSKGYDRYNDF